MQQRLEPNKHHDLELRVPLDHTAAIFNACADLTNSFGMEPRELSLWIDEEGISGGMRFDKQHHAFL